MAEAFLSVAKKAVATLPETAVSAADFAAHLKGRFSLPALDELNVPDLFLAFAALQGDHAGVKELDRRLRACAAKVDEDVVQQARQRLLIGEQPRLRAYGGRGALVKWLRTVVLSISIDNRRKEKPSQHTGDDALVVKASSEVGADVRLMKAQHRAEFTKAFAAALGSLDPKERTVLRMRFVDQLTLEDIGRALGTHRTTAMRWMETAFQKVLSGTRSRLAERLSLDGQELDSLWKMLEPSLADRLSKLLPPTRR